MRVARLTGKSENATEHGRSITAAFSGIRITVFQLSHKACRSCRQPRKSILYSIPNFFFGEYVV